MTEDITLYSGRVLTGIHEEEDCLMGFCSIHNPSDHALRGAPMEWMDAPISAMFRVCDHEYQHPDPDGLSYKMATGDWMTVEAITSVHLMEENCDGCCRND